MALPRPASPRRALADVPPFLRSRGKHQLIAAGLAILFPAIIVTGFWLDGKTNLSPPRKQLIYAESWTADRSDAEIRERQRIDSEAKAARALEKREAYKRLEKRLGL